MQGVRCGHEAVGGQANEAPTALEHQGRYGYRRITAELRRQGMAVNHKRVARLMREDNLVGTELQLSLDNLTGQRDHGEIYVNLANRLKLTHSRASQTFASRKFNVFIDLFVGQIDFRPI